MSWGRRNKGDSEPGSGPGFGPEGSPVVQGEVVAPEEVPDEGFINPGDVSGATTKEIAAAKLAADADPDVQSLENEMAEVGNELREAWNTGQTDDSEDNRQRCVDLEQEVARLRELYNQARKRAFTEALPPGAQFVDRTEQLLRATNEAAIRAENARKLIRGAGPKAKEKLIKIGLLEDPEHPDVQVQMPESKPLPGGPGMEPVERAAGVEATGSGAPEEEAETRKSLEKAQRDRERAKEAAQQFLDRMLGMAHSPSLDAKTASVTENLENPTTPENVLMLEELKKLIGARRVQSQPDTIYKEAKIPGTKIGMNIPGTGKDIEAFGSPSGRDVRYETYAGVLPGARFEPKPGDKSEFPLNLVITEYWADPRDPKMKKQDKSPAEPVLEAVKLTFGARGLYTEKGKPSKDMTTLWPGLKNSGFPMPSGKEQPRNRRTSTEPPPMTNTPGQDAVARRSAEERAARHGHAHGEHAEGRGPHAENHAEETEIDEPGPPTIEGPSGSESLLDGLPPDPKTDAPQDELIPPRVDSDRLAWDDPRRFGRFKTVQPDVVTVAAPEPNPDAITPPTAPDAGLPATPDTTGPEVPEPESARVIPLPGTAVPHPEVSAPAGGEPPEPPEPPVRGRHAKPLSEGVEPPNDDNPGSLRTGQLGKVPEFDQVPESEWPSHEAPDALPKRWQTDPVPQEHAVDRISRVAASGSTEHRPKSEHRRATREQGSPRIEYSVRPRSDEDREKWGDYSQLTQMVERVRQGDGRPGFEEFGLPRAGQLTVAQVERLAASASSKAELDVIREEIEARSKQEAQDKTKRRPGEPRLYGVPPTSAEVDTDKVLTPAERKMLKVLKDRGETIRDGNRVVTPEEQSLHVLRARAAELKAENAERKLSEAQKKADEARMKAERRREQAGVAGAVFEPKAVKLPEPEVAAPVVEAAGSGPESAEKLTDDKAVRLLSYADVLEGDAQRSAIEFTRDSQSGQRYTSELKQMVDKLGEDQVTGLAADLREEFLSEMESLGIEPTKYGESVSWAVWDLAKQSYYAKHPEETAKEYRTDEYGQMVGDPFDADPEVAERKRREIVDRHIGWEYEQAVASGRVDPSGEFDGADAGSLEVAKKLLESRRSGEPTQLRSYELTLLGRAARSREATGAISAPKIVPVPGARLAIEAAPVPEVTQPVPVQSPESLRPTTRDDSSAATVVVEAAQGEPERQRVDRVSGDYSFMASDPYSGFSPSQREQILEDLEQSPSDITTLIRRVQEAEKAKGVERPRFAELSGEELEAFRRRQLRAVEVRALANAAQDIDELEGFERDIHRREGYLKGVAEGKIQPDGMRTPKPTSPEQFQKLQDIIDARQRALIKAKKAASISPKLAGSAEVVSDAEDSMDYSLSSYDEHLKESGVRDKERKRKPNEPSTLTVLARRVKSQELDDDDILVKFDRVDEDPRVRARELFSEVKTPADLEKFKHRQLRDWEVKKLAGAAENLRELGELTDEIYRREVYLQDLAKRKETKENVRLFWPTDRKKLEVIGEILEARRVALVEAERKRLGYSDTAAIELPDRRVDQDLWDRWAPTDAWRRLKAEKEAGEGAVHSQAGANNAEVGEPAGPVGGEASREASTPQPLAEAGQEDRDRLLTLDDIRGRAETAKTPGELGALIKEINSQTLPAETVLAMKHIVRARHAALDELPPE